MKSYNPGDIGSDSSRWARQQTSQSPLQHYPQQSQQQQQQTSTSHLQEKENLAQAYAYQQQQQQSQNIFGQTSSSNTSQASFLNNQQQSSAASYRVNTDQSKSPRREKTVSLSRSQSGSTGSYQPQMDTYFLTGWGSSNQGQLSAQKLTNNAIQAFGNKVMSASAGENHTMIIDHKQELYACGSNTYGQLGIEGVAYLTKPTPIPALKDVKIQSVSCGYDHTFALTTQGEVYAWGLNLKGQLGIGTFENQFTPVLVYSLLPFGHNNKRAKRCGEDGAATATGDSSAQQQQHKRMKSQNDEGTSPGLVERSNSIENIMEQLNLLKMNSDKSKTAAGKNNVKNGGSTGFGGSDVLTSIQLGPEEVVQTIACGTLHTIVITSKNRMFSAGFGETYALGHGDKTTQNSFKLVQTMKFGLGRNLGGTGAHTQQSDSSPRAEKIEKISCGLSHSVCVAGGRAYIWGMCGSRQRESLVFPQPTELEFHSSGSSPIIDAQAGDSMTLFLNAKGETFALGENIEGQLCSEYATPNEYPQRISSLPSVSQIAVGKNFCLAVQRDMKYVFGWGSNAFGQVTGRLTSNPYLSGAVKVYSISSEMKEVKLICGSYHTIILTSKALSGSEFVLKEDEVAALASKDLKSGSNDCNNGGANADTVALVSIELEKSRKQLANETEKFTKEMEEKQAEIEALNQRYVALVKSSERHAKDVKLREQEFMKQLKEAKIKNESILAAAAAAMQNSNNANANSLLELQQLAAQQQQTQLAAQQKFQIKGADKFKNVNFRVFNSNLDIDFNELQLEQKISEGGYGIIHRAKWRETIVAVKKFKMVHDESTVRDFLSECHAMEALRHPNIVMFLGACTKAPNFCIILEYCQKGSLWSLLQSDIKLTWEDRRRIALDTAKGVHYLHSSNPPVLHRDLKSLNLLLDDNFRCKLADFGWTRVMSQDNYMTTKIGTYQWMAPEVISSNYYTEKADVFSFGIILWEIASREPPYRNKTGSAVSVEVVNNKLRPTIPKNCPIPFADLMQRCWDQDPNVRPSFKEIIKDLEKITFPKPI